MPMTRRSFLTATAATAVLTARPIWATAQISLGQARITTLSDGYLSLPSSFVFGSMPQDDLAHILAEYGVNTGTLETPCNVTLLQDEDRNVLFDTGSGPGFQGSAGKLPEALEVAGLTPDDITHVVFTHGHPDHLWGVMDDFDEPLFANARHMMGTAEWDYWWNPETVNQVGADRAAMAAGAKRRLELLEGSIHLFDDGDELIPRVAARATYGHSPGHMSFELRSGSNAVMIAGDAVINHHVAFERPDWHSGSDQDQAMAAKSRMGLLDQLATEQIQIVGFHLSHGGIGQVERKGDAYRFVPLGA